MKINKILTTLSGIAMLALMMLVVVQVFMRYILLSPLSWSEEISRVIVVWFSMIGTYVAVRQGKHLHIEAIRKWTGKRGAQIGFILEQLIVLIFIGFLVRYGIEYCRLSLKLHQKFASIHIPKVYVYCTFPIIGTLIGVRTVRDLVTFIVRKGQLPDRGGSRIDMD